MTDCGEWMRQVVMRLMNGERFRIVYRTEREACYDFDEFCRWLRPVGGWRACRANGRHYVEMGDGRVYFSGASSRAFPSL